MTEEEFANMAASGKWSHIKTMMDYIVRMDSMYTLRKRYNPHHPLGQQKDEERNLRADQYQRWAHLKNLYANHRDELTDTLGVPEYESCKSIIERVFTQELDDALRDVIENS